jgi:hypothetical protein
MLHTPHGVDGMEALVFPLHSPFLVDDLSNHLEEECVLDLDDQ